jgi:DNA modification methylase
VPARAAERTGRRARLIEISPTFVDAAIERWQQLTGGTAVLAESGQPFGRTTLLRSVGAAR